jgi:hypothetical protein
MLQTIVTVSQSPNPFIPALSPPPVSFFSLIRDAFFFVPSTLPFVYHAGNQTSHPA